MIRNSSKLGPPRRRLLPAAVLGASLLTGSVAFAQITPQGGEAAAGGSDRGASRNERVIQNQSQGQGSQPSPERVIVTGSFIPTAEGEGALPVSVFTQDDLRKFGATSAVEGLRRLPSFVGAADTENNSNGGVGAAGVNLRGLGQVNTLVLLNGHRAGTPSLLSGFTDINLIPFGAIDHVEVLKDGASAQYGSDAVAGVVNFIFKTQYQGALIDFQFGNTTNNDQSTVRASVLTGFSTSDKRFNIVLNANYFHANSIDSRDRFLSSVADARRFGGTNTESPTYPGRIQVTGATATALGFGAVSTQLVLQDDVASRVVPTAPGNYRVFNAGAGDGFNFRTQTPAIPERERFAYYGATDYQVVEKAVDVYAFGLISNNRQYNSLASAPFTFGNSQINPTFNPTLAALYNPGGPLNGGAATGERAILRQSPFNPFIGSTIPGVTPNSLQNARYRLLEIGPRLALNEVKAYYGAFGVKGEVLRTFNYDITFLHDEDKTVITNGGDARRSILEREIAAGNFNPFRGAASPIAGTVTNANGTFSYDNAAAGRRASYIANSTVFNNLNLVEARLSNTFFPDAPQGGVSVALGAEYRRDALDVQSDPILLTNDQLGFGAAPSYHAVQDVRSVFGELRFPVVIPTMKVPGIYSLAFTVAGRYQKFLINGIDPNTFLGVNPTFETTNPKYAVEYQPIPDVKFRASYSTSFRAPSFADLFAGGGQDFPVLNDPYGKSPLGQNYQPAGPNGDPTGGNPALTPENSDNYTAGLVLTPRFVPGLNITVDYYQINQKNLIVPGASVAQLIVDQNFRSSNKALFVPGVANAFNDPNAAFAANIQRDPADGTILSVDERSLNAASRFIEGIDVGIFYELDTMNTFKRDFGKFNLALNYNHFFRFKARTLAGSPIDDFNGNFNNSGLTPGSIPFNKATGIVEYQFKGFDFVTTVNYIGDFIDQPGSNRNVREYTTLDLQLSYTFKAPEALTTTTTTSKDDKGKAVVSNAPSGRVSFFQKLLGGTTLTVGVNDVFDTPPPFSAGRLNDNYDTSLYSIRNRFVYGGISKKF